MAAKTMAAQWDGIDKQQFITKMYHKMFETHPEWQGKFKKLTFPINDSDAAFVKQVDVTRAAFDAAVQMAKNDEDAKLKSTLQAMAKRHINYGVTQTEFQALKPVLVATVGDQVSGADKAAWEAVVTKVLDGLVP